MTTHPEPACRPHVAAGNDYWHEPRGRETDREKTWREQMAKAICSTCPVREACAAAVTDDDDGIWGGATLADRAATRVCGDGVGTVKGYRRHMRAQDTPCRACSYGWAAYKRELREKGAAA